jgi:hypothetical protein
MQRRHAEAGIEATLGRCKAKEQQNFRIWRGVECRWNGHDRYVKTRCAHGERTRMRGLFVGARWLPEVHACSQQVRDFCDALAQRSGSSLSRHAKTGRVYCDLQVPVYNMRVRFI